MEYTPSFRDSLVVDIKPSFAHALSDEEVESRKFGLPKYRKYPMPDAAHVKSAIKFFNYVNPDHEKELANAILARMDEYDIDPDSINIGDTNRFKKYVKKTYLKHHGIKGMHWGVRRYQNPDGSLTAAGQKRYNKLADRGDKLRAKGLGEHTRGMMATKSEKAAAAGGLGLVGGLSFAIPSASLAMPVYNISLLAIDASRRQAIQASISRERKTKMDQVRKANQAREMDMLTVIKKRQQQLDDTFKKVYGNDSKFDYTKIYKEMGVDMRSEDPDDYRKAESDWLRKHSTD